MYLPVGCWPAWPYGPLPVLATFWQKTRSRPTWSELGIQQSNVYTRIFALGRPRPFRQLSDRWHQDRPAAATACHGPSRVNKSRHRPARVSRLGQALRPCSARSRANPPRPGPSHGLVTAWSRSSHDLVTVWIMPLPPGRYAWNGPGSLDAIGRKKKYSEKTNILIRVHFLPFHHHRRRRTPTTATHILAVAETPPTPTPLKPDSDVRDCSRRATRAARRPGRGGASAWRRSHAEGRAPIALPNPPRLSRLLMSRSSMGRITGAKGRPFMARVRGGGTARRRRCCGRAPRSGSWRGRPAPVCVCVCARARARARERVRACVRMCVFRDKIK